MIRLNNNSIDSNNNAHDHQSDDHSSFNLPNISESPPRQQQQQHQWQQRQQQQQQQRQQDGTSSNANANNDAKSVIFILEQIISLLKITLQTSSKLITPAITQMIQNIIPIIQQYYQQAAPIRIQEWVQIFTSALQHFLTIMSETDEGRIVLDQFHDVTKTSLHLFTSANTRQIIVEGVGMQVKMIEAIRTPEMKAFISSIPVYTIRILDMLSSGEAKYLYHSISSLVNDVIELLGQDETTLALAEITAHLVHVLEQERVSYGSWNHHRKQRKVRRVRHVKVSSMRRRARDIVAVANAKKRHVRNRFIAQTYTDRAILKDARSEDGSTSGMEGGDRLVEDAILSSLGDTRSDNAWLTSLGRQEYDEDEMGMGGRTNEKSMDVKLPKILSIPKLNEPERASVLSDNGESYDAEINFGESDDVGEDTPVDLAYLRNGIETRKKGSVHSDTNIGEERDEGWEGKNGRVQIQSMHRLESSNLHTSTRSVAGDSVAEDSLMSAAHMNDDGRVAIEDLVLGLDHSADTQKSPLKKGVSQDNQHGSQDEGGRRRRINLMHEDNDSDEDYDPIPIHTPTTRDKLDTHHDITSEGGQDARVRGSYSSISHFYRSLEDISSKIRDKTITNILKERKDQSEDGHDSTKTSSNLPGVSPTHKWQPKAAAAAGAGNEQGQEVLQLRRKTSRQFQANFEVDGNVKNGSIATTEGGDKYMGVWKGLMDIFKKFVMAIPLKQKIIIGSTIFVIVVIAFIWFILGCFGLYFLVQQKLTQFQQIYENGNASSMPNEIILRIVQDNNIHVDQSKIVNAAADAIQKAIQTEEL